MFLGKIIILGVTGSILSYKAIDLAYDLVSKRADVHVVMTKHATNFINPLVFETVTGNKCITDIFDGNGFLGFKQFPYNINADIMIVAPVSANSLSRLSRGMSEDALTKAALTCSCPKILAPALNYPMYKNPIVQDNIDILKAYGFEILNPKISKPLSPSSPYEVFMAPNDEIIAYSETYLTDKKDLKGLKILIISGPTREAINSLEFITVPSTGKTGYALAKACMLRGADVTLITGKTHTSKPQFINIIEAVSTKDMLLSVSKIYKEQNIIIDASKSSSFFPAHPDSYSFKPHEDTLIMKVKKNPDISCFIGKHKTKNQFVCAMSIETQNIMSTARNKLINNNLDMVIASNLKSIGTEITNDTNIVTVITKESEIQLKRMTKNDMAHKIIDQILMEINL